MQQILLLMKPGCLYGESMKKSVTITMKDVYKRQVLVKGTTSGVITDIDGNYVLLNVNPDAILIFSYVGYQTQELNVSGLSLIHI